jgi:hypothetical protein
MFNRAICGQGLPVRLSFDHDPLFQFQRWQANLRVLGIETGRRYRWFPGRIRLWNDSSEASGPSIWISSSIGMRRT